MLTVRGVETFYGQSQALFGIDLALGHGEVMALLGRNGMGKTTTVRSIMGLTRPRSGSIDFEGQALIGRPSHAIARLGIGLVPEGRRVFPNLTVRENLVATARDASGAGSGSSWTLDRVLSAFPRLDERRHQMGRTLSGGEQQMLAIGRALMTNPRLLILDEATEGLAPLIRREIWDCLADLRDQHLAILVIDKNLADLMRLADRVTLLEKGRTMWTGTASEFSASPELARRYIEV